MQAQLPGRLEMPALRLGIKDRFGKAILIAVAALCLGISVANAQDEKPLTPRASWCLEITDTGARWTLPSDGPDSWYVLDAYRRTVAHGKDEVGLSEQSFERLRRAMELLDELLNQQTKNFDFVISSPEDDPSPPSVL